MSHNFMRRTLHIYHGLKINSSYTSTFYYKLLVEIKLIILSTFVINDTFTKH